MIVVGTPALALVILGQHKQLVFNSINPKIGLHPQSFSPLTVHTSNPPILSSAVELVLCEQDENTRKETSDMAIYLKHYSSHPSDEEATIAGLLGHPSCLSRI